MLIGELAKASGCSRDTIRYYEKIGLLELPQQARRQNNYKDYPNAVLRRLKAIRNLKELGFTLEEIREILVRRDIKALDSGATFRIVEQKLIHLEHQIDQLQLYKQRLEQARLRMEGNEPDKFIPLTGIIMRAA